MTGGRGRRGRQASRQKQSEESKAKNGEFHGVQAGRIAHLVADPSL
jgi:hypothetical protein